MKEKDLYSLIKDFLLTEKNCFSEYTGTELSFGNKMRADVYGVAKNAENEKIIYLLEGKIKLDGRNHFSKVLLETIPLQDYADCIYIFGKEVENFEINNNEYIRECKKRGIGILLINENNEVYEYLKPQRKYPNSLSNKETIYRIFKRKTEKIIADIIFQAAYEYITLKTDKKCAKFIDIYNSLFPKEEYKQILNEVIGKHVLNEIGMRKAFEMEYGKSYYVGIKKVGNKRIEDEICLNDKSKEKSKPPILLD